MLFECFPRTTFKPERLEFLLDCGLRFLFYFLSDETIIRDYEERLKALEQERQQKESTEKENEELRARVLELERLVRVNNENTAVT